MLDDVDRDEKDAGAATGLITLPPEYAMDVFVVDGDRVQPSPKIEPYLEYIREQVDLFLQNAPDVSTKAGRAAIKSMARKIAISKTHIDDAGKALAAKTKAIPNKIDATRKHVRDTLDKWRDEVREPVTLWEEEEKRQQDARNQILAELADRATAGISAAEIRAELASVEALEIETRYGEDFAGSMVMERARAVRELRARLAQREKHEADEAELIALREAAAAREQIDREERIRQEAAAAARDQERRASEERETALRQQAAAAEQAARDAEQRAQREAERAAAEQERRRRNEQHKAVVHEAAVMAIAGAGIKPAIAATVIDLIASGTVPRVSITY